MPPLPASKPSPEKLAELFQKAGISLTQAQTELFWTFHGFLRERNEELNMTRIYEFESMVLKLYIDSAIVGKLLPLPSPLLDIGTGPGFPGLPLAILHPGVQFLLSEGREKRNEFLRASVAKLRLKNVEILGHRIAPGYERQVGGVITRAVEVIGQTLQRTLLCLPPGGRAIFMKGPDCDDEIAAADRKHGRFFKKSADIAYALPGATDRRRLVVYERTEAPAPRVPQGEIIQSEDNERFRTWRSLQSSRGIRKENLAMAGGSAALEILRIEPDATCQVVLRQGMKTLPEMAGMPMTVLTEKLFDELKSEGANLPLVVVTVPEIKSLAGEFPERCLIIGLQDPNAVGAVIRSAVHFGIPDIVLTKEAAHPFLPKALAQSGAAALQARYWNGMAVADLPQVEGGYRVAGIARILKSDRPLRLFIGPQHPAGWPDLGAEDDIPLEPGALVAAVLAAIGDQDHS